MIHEKRLLRTLDLGMSKTGMRMRNGCFQATERCGHVIQPLLNVVNGRSHRRRNTFEIGVSGHGRSL
jgi:hypothetical protein